MDNAEDNRKLLKKAKRRNPKTGELEDVPDHEEVEEEKPKEEETPVAPEAVEIKPKGPEKKPRGVWYKGQWKPDPYDSDDSFIGDLFEGHDLVAWVTDGRHDNVHHVKEICFGRKKVGSDQPSQPYQRLVDSNVSPQQPVAAPTESSNKVPPAAVRYEDILAEEDFVGWVLDGRKDNFHHVNHAVFGKKQVGVRAVAVDPPAKP